MKRILKKAKKYITTVIAGKTPKAKKVRRNLLVVLGIVIFFIVLIFVLKGCNGKKANKQTNEHTSTQYETRPHGTEATTKEPTKKTDSTDSTDEAEEDSSTETEKTQGTSTNGSRSNGYSYGYSNTGSNKTPAPPTASDNSESGIRTPGENITSSQEPSIKVDPTVPNDPSDPTTKPTIPEVEPTTPAPSVTPKRDDDESPYPSNDPTESTTPTPTPTEPSTPEPTEPTTPTPTEPTTPEPTTPTPTEPSVKEEPPPSKILKVAWKDLTISSNFASSILDIENNITKKQRSKFIKSLNVLIHAGEPAGASCFFLLANFIHRLHYHS